jgi:MFS family permease
MTTRFAEGHHTLQGFRMRGSVTKSFYPGNQILRSNDAPLPECSAVIVVVRYNPQDMADSSSSQTANTSAGPPPQAGAFALPRDITPAERKTLIAGGLGWMLDAMDVMLFSLVVAYLLGEFSMDTRIAGFLNSLTLIASAIGGFLFGFLADRMGRTRALMASILVYSLASAACAFTHTVPQLAFFRFVLGLGMGGEWTTAAALIAETWRPEHRGKALGLMQSAYAIGEAIAALVVAVVLPYFGWRAVFLVGVLPALVVLWIRRRVPESDLWKQRASQARRVALSALLRGETLRNGILATAMNSFAMFGYWGLFIWIPGYLSLPVAQGGRGLSLAKTTSFFLLLCGGKWLGYTLFGFFADAYGRKRPYFGYLLIAALLVPVYGLVHTQLWLLILGPLVGFFGIGFFSGFAAIASEIFPGEIRATAMGLSYNIGRGLSAAAPFAVGSLALHFGIGTAFLLPAGAYLIAAMLALLLPETRGRPLT